MKRSLMVLALALVAFLPVFADGINLGDFPLGTWLDPNYDAVWEFKSNNIRILALDGSVYYDFDQMGIQDFKVGAGTDGPFLSFSSEATGKQYKFTKPLLSADMIMEIMRPELPDYKVTMPKR